MNHGSLFSGIEGFGLAAEWMGWTNIFQVEIDEFCNKVLEKHFPNVQRFKNIKQFDGNQFRGQVDIITGGFPCQPFSVAGKQRGKEDDRFLWPEMRRVISEIRPNWVVAENVRGLISQGGGVVFEQVLSDLEAEGYEVQPFIIPACAVNAPHRRDRVWIVAHSNAGYAGQKGRISEGIQRGDKSFAEFTSCNLQYGTISSNPAKQGLPITGQIGIGKLQKKEGEGMDDRPELDNSNASDPEGTRLEGRNPKGTGNADGRNSKHIISDIGNFKTESWDENWIEVATRLCNVDDGIPGRLARPKGWRVNALKAGGNAIVPQIAFEIFKAIDKIDKIT